MLQWVQLLVTVSNEHLVISSWVLHQLLMTMMRVNQNSELINTNLVWQWGLVCFVFLIMDRLGPRETSIRPLGLGESLWWLVISQWTLGTHFKHYTASEARGLKRKRYPATCVFESLSLDTICSPPYIPLRHIRRRHLWVHIKHWKKTLRVKTEKQTMTIKRESKTFLNCCETINTSCTCKYGHFWRLPAGTKNKLYVWPVFHSQLVTARVALPAHSVIYLLINQLTFIRHLTGVFTDMRERAADLLRYQITALHQHFMVLLRHRFVHLKNPGTHYCPVQSHINSTLCCMYKNHVYCNKR